MGKESAEIRKVQDELGEDFYDPIFGGGRKQERQMVSNAEIRYFVGCITNEATRMELEDIMTKSMRCQDKKEVEPGDVWVISETGTFDKEGCYQVVVKYLVVPENV